MKGFTQALIAAAWIAAGAATAPMAWAGVDISVNVAPPAPPVEVVPAPRAGFVWAPGFYEWRGGAHVWVPGRWITGRPGYHWVPDRWAQHGPNWHREAGHWARG